MHFTGSIQNVWLATRYIGVKIVGSASPKGIQLWPNSDHFWLKEAHGFLKKAIFEFVCEQLFFQKVSEEEEELINQQISEGKVSQTNNIFV